MVFMTFHVCKSLSFTDHQFLSKLFFPGLSKAYFGGSEDFLKVSQNILRHQNEFVLGFIILWQS